MTPRELIELIEQSPELQEVIRVYALAREHPAIPERIESLEAEVAERKRAEEETEDLKVRQQGMENDMIELRNEQFRMENDIRGINYQ